MKLTQFDSDAQSGTRQEIEQGNSKKDMTLMNPDTRSCATNGSVPRNEFGFVPKFVSGS